jgi:glycosyltransferase involved in cell wall biosynthesis
MTSAELNHHVASDLPLVTVAVCTHDQPADLETSLRSLLYVDYPKLDILVVDSAPPDNAVEHIVDCLETVRYVREPREGRDRARNRAMRESRGELIAFVEEGEAVDHGWVKRLVARERYSHDGTRAHSGVWDALRDRVRTLRRSRVRT